MGKRTRPEKWNSEIELSCDSSYTLKGDPSSSVVCQCGGKCLNGPSVTLSPASHIGNDPVRFHIHTTGTYVQSSSRILAILDSSSAIPAPSRYGAIYGTLQPRMST